MVFWILLGIFCLASVLPILLAWKRAKGDVSSEKSLGRAMYEARLLEVEADFKLGRIDEFARDAAIAEEGRRLLRLNDTSAGLADTTQRPGSAIIVLVIFILVPAVSLGLYKTLGNPAIGVASFADRAHEARPSLEDLLKVAEQRLETNPDDARGWEVVAPVYIRMGRLDDAENAYRNLLRLDDTDLTTKLALAELLMLKQNGRIGDEAMAIFEEINTAEPANPNAKLFLGLAAQQQGDPNKAKAIWKELLLNAKGTEPWIPAVRDQLAALDNSGKAGLDLSDSEMERVNAMVDGLAARLSEERGTQEDWQRLIRSYMVLGKTVEAAEAFDRAAKLFKGETEFISSLQNLVSNGASGNNKP